MKIKCNVHENITEQLQVQNAHITRGILPRSKRDGSTDVCVVLIGIWAEREGQAAVTFNTRQSTEHTVKKTTPINTFSFFKATNFPQCKAALFTSHKQGGRNTNYQAYHTQQVGLPVFLCKTTLLCLWVVTVGAEVGRECTNTSFDWSKRNI